jgi:hypothetical protein
VLPPDANEQMAEVVRVFARQVEHRSPTRVVTRGEAPLTITLALDPDIGPDGFRIRDLTPGNIDLAGRNERGVLYGLGKLLRASRYDQGGFTPGPWRGASVPRKPVRGIYFATHFHNFYHDAPTADIQRYVEELGLWGFNALMVWYDMHHFNGADDPAAVAFRRHLHGILAAARRIGLDVGVGVIANEAYGNSPPELRADPSARRGGWHDCAVCPSKPGGMDYILGVLGGEFDWVAAKRTGGRQ